MEIRRDLWIFFAPNPIRWTGADGYRSDSCSVWILVWQGRERESKGRGKNKDGKGKGKDKSKDQKPISKPEQFQGYCGYCDKLRHKRADCSKRIADARSKGGAAATSADDGDVAAVMEMDDVVMRTGDDETSIGWCFSLTSMSAVVGSTGSLLLDSGSDEHLCTPKFADF